MSGIILVDFSNLLYRAFFAQFKPEDVSIDLMRHLTLACVLKYRRQFSKDIYEEMVLCLDGGGSWRQDIFPEYKWSRKNRPDQSEKDKILSERFFEVFRTICAEVVEHFPYCCVNAKKVEGDDGIAVLTREAVAQGRDVVIVSTDKDMVQLMIYPKVDIWHPDEKGLLKAPRNPKRALLEFVIRGDSGDGIPNFLMPNDTFVNKIRQKSIMTVKLEKWLDIGDHKKFCETLEQVRNFERNRTCIDFSFIPPTICIRTKEALESSREGLSRRKMKFYKYLMTNQLRQHLDNIGSF